MSFVSNQCDLRDKYGSRVPCYICEEQIKTGPYQVRTKSVPPPYQVHSYRYGDSTDLIRR